MAGGTGCLLPRVKRNTVTWDGRPISPPHSHQLQGQGISTQSVPRTDRGICGPSLPWPSFFFLQDDHFREQLGQEGGWLGG